MNYYLIFCVPNYASGTYNASAVLLDDNGVVYKVQNNEPSHYWIKNMAVGMDGWRMFTSLTAPILNHYIKFDSASNPTKCYYSTDGSTVAYTFNVVADARGAVLPLDSTTPNATNDPKNHYNCIKNSYATANLNYTPSSTYTENGVEYNVVVWGAEGNSSAPTTTIYQIQVDGTAGDYSETYDGSTKFISLWSSTNNGTTYSQVNTDVTWYRNGSAVPSGSVSVGKVYTHDKNVCSDTISATVNGTSAASINFEITAKTVSVSGTVVNNKTYDGNTNATISSGNYGSLVNAVSGDDVYISAVTGTFASLSAGKNKTVNLTYTLAGQDVGNYVNPVTGTATANILHKVEFGIVGFTPRYTTASTVTKTYRGSNYTVRIYVDGSAIGNSGYSYAWTRSSNVNAPNGYSSTCRDADANSYTMSCAITETATGDTYNLPLLTLNITKKQLTASGTTVSDKVFDGTTTATVTTSISGISNSEVTVTPTATFPDIHKGEDQEVTVVYAFTAGTAANQANYILPVTETKLASIEARQVTIGTPTITQN